MYISKLKTYRNTSRNERDIDTNSEIVKQFQMYAAELEDKHDRYERIVKISRDITIESKRLIFFLHTFKRETPEGQQVLREAKSRLMNIVRSHFNAIRNELLERDIHQYLRAFCFGVQEFIEAFSFYHYLQSNQLLTYKEVQDFFCIYVQSKNLLSAEEFVEKEEFEVSEKFIRNTSIVGKEGKEKNNLIVKEQINEPNKPREVEFSDKYCIITIVDYVLGLNDLTGELMRYCINQVACGQIENAFNVCQFLCSLYTGMLSVGYNNREYNRKMYTVIQSVKKVEMACYTVRVRGSEMPRHMIVNIFENEEEVEEIHF